jgi:chromosome segregation ATPase
MWPNPANFVARPSVEMLKKYTLPAFKAPEPLPEKLLERYAVYQKEVRELLQEKETVEKEIEKKSPALGEAESGLKNVNKWSRNALAGAEATLARVSSEMVSLQAKKANIENRLSQAKKDGSLLVEIVRIQGERLASYKDYMAKYSLRDDAW